MDIPKLIKLVREREELYNVKHPEHRNRVHIAAIWMEIGNQLNTTDIEAKNKWQNLRSNFMRERRKVKAAMSVSEAHEMEISWPYFHMMTFLDASLRNISNMSRESMPIERIQVDLEEAVPVDMEQTHSNYYIGDTMQEEIPTPGNSNCTAELTVSKTKKRKCNISKDEFDRQKVLCTSADQDDPDLLFFKSLLPQVRKLDPNENLRFKVEVAQLLLQKLQSREQPSSHDSLNSSDSDSLHDQPAAFCSPQLYEN